MNNNDATEATMREVRDILAGVNTETDNSRPTRATEATLREVRDLLQNGGGGGGGGSGVFVAHFEVTFDENENMNVVTCDKTADEIVDAYVSNEFVCAKILFYETIPEVTAFDIYASDDQQDGKTLQIYSHRVFVGDYAQASVGDALVSTEIYYDFVHEQWHMQEVGYALTPYSE